MICARPYHALFMHTMLIRPNAEELEDFGQPDYVIYNAGQFPANQLTAGMTSKTSIDLDFERRELVILGTEYAGEMKKGVFTVMNYLMPKQGVLSMHCSATADRASGRSLAVVRAVGHRQDDALGRLAAAVDRRRRTLLERRRRVQHRRGLLRQGDRSDARERARHLSGDCASARCWRTWCWTAEEHRVDFHDVSITENTRGAYPIDFIRSAKIPCVAGHPTDVIFLTCDAFGVLPPVSSLTPAQAMYHFISGYTAKVAGTEVGVTEPQATFSPCFGGPFLVWHPTKYAELLADKVARHNARVWLVNTGWTGGSYGVGRRIPLAHTRAIIDAIHAGRLAGAKTVRDPVFGIDAIVECPGVPAEMLIPREHLGRQERLRRQGPASGRAVPSQLRGLFVRRLADAGRRRTGDRLRPSRVRRSWKPFRRPSEPSRGLAQLLDHAGQELAQPLAGHQRVLACGPTTAEHARGPMQHGGRHGSDAARPGPLPHDVVDFDRQRLARLRESRGPPKTAPARCRQTSATTADWRSAARA